MGKRSPDFEQEFLCLSDWSGDGFTTAAYASAVLPRREGGLAAAAVYLPAPPPDPRSRQSSFEGPPPYQPGYQPEKSPSVPIPVGVRRCDNYYNGGSVLPCLMRPQLPPFSYSTEKYYNTEYKKKK